MAALLTPRWIPVYGQPQNHPELQDIFLGSNSTVWMPHTGELARQAAPSFSGLMRTNGIAGAAADIAATADRIQFAVDHSAEATLFAVVSFDVATSGKVLMSVMSSATRGHYLSVEAGGLVSAASTNDAVFSVASGPAVQVGRELHVVGVFKANRRLVFVNGVQYTANTAVRTLSSMTTLSVGCYLNAGAAASPVDGRVYLAGHYPKAITDGEAQTLSENLWGGVFTGRRQFVPVIVSSGGVTITGTPGNAVAAGVAARVNQARAVTGTTGNAAAAGVTAKVNQARTVTGAVGNAAAAGVTATVNLAVSIAATPGNAVAAGVNATITAAGAVVITGTPGNAAAAGVSASINQARSVTGTAGNAVAAGVQATISTAGAGVTITATPGNAFASGPQAIIVRNVAIAAAVGNAVAAGRQATVSNITATDDLYPLEGMSQDYPLQGMTQTYPLAGQTPS